MFFFERVISVEIIMKELELVPYLVDTAKTLVIIALIYISFYRLSVKLDPYKKRDLKSFLEKLALTVAMCLTPIVRWIYVVFIITLHLSLLLPSVQEAIKKKIEENENSI